MQRRDAGDRGRADPPVRMGERLVCVPEKPPFGPRLRGCDDSCEVAMSRRRYSGAELTVEEEEEEEEEENEQKGAPREKNKVAGARKI